MSPYHHDPPPVRVLVADDAEDLRDVLVRLLRHDGRCEVVGEAADGAQLVDLVGERRPDVVLVDLSMPVLSGQDAILKIRDMAP
ncbi:MAG: response regulator transcription factor, partial [Actinomycetota bacterium]|nr:response regulator transcription factor [Actinomycetota bacterium]